MSTAEAFAEISFVILTVFPEKLSETIEFTFVVVTTIKISILEVFHAITVFQKIHKFSFVPISLGVSKHSEAIGLSFDPLADISISFIVFPHAAAVFQVIDPFSFIDLSIGPFVLPLSMHFPALIFSFIRAAVAKFLESFSMSEVVYPVPLICLSAIVYHDADAISFGFASESLI